MGALGDQRARALLDHSDCVISLGVLRFDTNTGFWTDRIDPAALIAAEPDSLRIRHHKYDRVPIDRVVEALADLDPVADWEIPRFDPVPVEISSRSKDRPELKVADLIAGLLKLDQSKYSFVADVGDSWFIGLELRADVFLAPGYYASMGFGVRVLIAITVPDAPAVRPGGGRGLPDDRDRALHDGGPEAPADRPAPE